MPRKVLFYKGKLYFSADTVYVPTKLSQLQNDVGYVTTDNKVYQDGGYISNDYLGVLLSGGTDDTDYTGFTRKNAALTFNPYNKNFRLTDSSKYEINMSTNSSPMISLYKADDGLSASTNKRYLYVRHDDIWLSGSDDVAVVDRTWDGTYISLKTALSHKLCKDGDSMTGRLIIAGTASEGRLMTRSIWGCTTGASPTKDALHLQYGNDVNDTVFFGNSGGGKITNNGTKYSGAAALNVLKTGDTMSGTLTFNKVTNAIAYQGTKATTAMIKFKDNTNDAYGNGIYIGGGGATIIGGGESSDAMAGAVNGGDEVCYIGNDGDVNIFSNLQEGWSSRKAFTFSRGGGLKLSGGRFSDSGDDEGIIISTASNGYGGLCIGTPTARRSVFYLNDYNAFWRYNNGSTSFDILHPQLAGTILLKTATAWGTSLSFTMGNSQPLVIINATMIVIQWNGSLSGTWNLIVSDMRKDSYKTSSGTGTRSVTLTSGTEVALSQNVTISMTTAKKITVSVSSSVAMVAFY